MLSGTVTMIEGEHPEFTLADWQHEVAKGDTRLGYWAWVEARLAYEADAVDARPAERKAYGRPR